MFLDTQRSIANKAAADAEALPFTGVVSLSKGEAVARIKFVSVSDLVSAKPKERQPSPRQLAAMKRESQYEKAIGKLTSGKVAVFEPTGEKLSTLRASLARVIARNERSAELHYAIKGGVAYVGLEPIPGVRSGGRKKKA